MQCGQLIAQRRHLAWPEDLAAGHDGVDGRERCLRRFGQRGGVLWVAAVQCLGVSEDETGEAILVVGAE